MSTREEREKEIIDMASALEGQIVDKDFKINGATIENICKFEAGGYKRVKAWLLERIQSQHLDEEVEIDREATIANPGNDYVESEIEEMSQFYKEAYDLMMSRNQKYGDSWKVLTIQSIANLIEMKMHRIANMKTKDLDPKIVDEFIDSMNYSAMGLYKYKNEV